MIDPAADRLRTALELYELGERMVRQRLRRTNPDDDDDGIESMVLAWLQARPGAQHGDAPGRLTTRLG